MKRQKILAIGLGQIGYNNAEYMTSLGLNVAEAKHEISFLRSAGIT